MPKKPNTKPCPIGQAIHPVMSEFFSEYAVVGFTADKGKPVMLRTKSDAKSDLALSRLLLAAVQQYNIDLSYSEEDKDL